MREPLGPTAEGLSGASFERVELNGRRYVVKRLSRETDWVMRAAHDTGVPYAAKLHRAGVFTELDTVDAALVEVAYAAVGHGFVGGCGNCGPKYAQTSPPGTSIAKRGDP